MIADRKEAIMFIANKRHGSMDDLVGMIGEKFFNQFYREPNHAERSNGYCFYSLGV